MLRQTLAFMLLLLPLAAFAKVKPIALEHFYQMPMVDQPAISPNGKNIAVILNQDSATQVAVMPYDKPQQIKILVKLDTEKFRIEDIYWANNERVLVSVTQPFKIDAGRYRATRLYSAHVDGGDTIELRQKKRKQTQTEFYYANPYLLSLLEDDTNHILVTTRAKRDNFYASVFKVNVNTGKFTKHLANTKRIVDWGVTAKGTVLLAIGIDRNDTTDVEYIYTRKNPQSEWALAKTREDFQSETFFVQMYDVDTNSIIVLSDHIEDNPAEKNKQQRKTGLWRFDIKSGKFTEQLGKAPGSFDINGVITRREGNRRDVIGYTYYDDFQRYVYFDAASDTIAKQIRNVFAKNDLQATLWDWDSKKQRYLVAVVGDNQPIEYYLFDATNNKLTHWYGQYPDLKRAQLAGVMSFDFKARDGMDLHGYLTMPNNVDNPPLVVFPHGGPFARDYRYFDPFVQMFASRGYAVLQVNFRGSTGYGNHYVTSGYGQWGQKMQTDILDGMNWVKEYNLANTNNACIVGASYGGYAALVAGYKTPDAFKCIISIAGISDMTAQVSFWTDRGQTGYIDNAVSSAAADMKQISPALFANAFKAPVLLIHGKADTRVKFAQSEIMYDALKKAGKKVEIELFKYGTHQLSDASNREKTMKLMEEFLKQHLK